MQIGETTLAFALNRFLRFSPSKNEASPGPSRFEQEQLQRRADATNVLQQAISFRDALASAQAVLDGVRAKPSRAATALSSAPMLFSSPAGAAATLSSSAEVNAETTSFTPKNPAFAGLSTLTVSVDGVYDGAQGTGALTFVEKKNGIRGINDLEFEVFDPAMNKIENVTIDKEHPVSQVYTLSNGLRLTFGNGILVDNDSFRVDVDDDDPQAVDPDKPFNGTGSSDPNFEFGVSVASGSFDVNGVSIAVNASDSINDVAQRITASAANVSAVFFNGSERLVLTQKSTGSANTIVLANDTSGFLNATKLAGGTLVPGADSDPSRPIDQVSELTGISSGTLKVNDVDITIDVGVDSLNDVLARIDQSAAGVSARLVAGGQRIEIVNDDKKSVLTLDDGDTAFFTTLNITPGTLKSSGSELSKPQAAEVGDAIAQVAARFNAFYAASNRAGTAQPDLDALREEIRGAVEEVRDSLRRGERPRFAIEFDFDNPKTVLNFEQAQRESFEKRIRTGFVDLREVFNGRRGRPGLFDDISATLEQRIVQLRSRAQIIGGLINTIA